MIKVIPLMLLLCGCASIGPYGYDRGVDPYARALYGVPDAVVVTRQPEVYTRAEIDAINAETMCRTNARNTLQAARCGIRR
jgi:hypothetical protein